MGTANKQIATRANVNSKRFGAFVTGTNGGTYMKKCVTKKAVTDIEFLTVNNRQSTTYLGPSSNTVNSQFGTQGDIHLAIKQNGGSYNTISAEITSSNLTNSYNSRMVHCRMYCNTYNTTNGWVMNYSGKWPSTAAMAPRYAIYKRTLTVPTNTAITLNMSEQLEAMQSDSLTGSAGAINIYPDSVTWNVGYLITNSDDSYTIASVSPQNYYTYHATNTITFTSNYSSINIYLIITYFTMSFNPIAEEYYTGFMVSSVSNLTYYESNYDQTYKLAQYQDIAKKAGTFTCKYAIYNNKSSNAKLDFVRVYISATSDRSKGTWTQIGSASPGTVDGYKTGDITCTIPLTQDVTKQLYMYVHCGNTNLNQTWYSGWGNYVANFKPSENCGKVDNAKTPVTPVLSDVTSVDIGHAGSVLNYTEISSYAGASGGTLHKGYIGRTDTCTALFRIE